MAGRTRRNGRAGLARLGRAEWIEAARRALVDGGIGAVKVDLLAKAMNVTRGSFYWHFASREDLLDALIETWRRVNTEPFAAVLDHDGDRPVAQLVRFVSVWLDTRRFDPAFDAAMRDWARAADTVATLVREADLTRMGLLKRIFLAIGYDPIEAEVRARVTYYHQVGYYALHIMESIDERHALLPTYFKVLGGLPMPPGALPLDAEENEIAFRDHPEPRAPGVGDGRPIPGDVAGRRQASRRRDRTPPH